MEKLYEQVQPTITAISVNFERNSGIDRQEFQSLANEVFCKCIKKFNPELPNASFKAFFTTCFKNAGITLIKKEKKYLKIDIDKHSVVKNISVKAMQDSFSLLSDSAKMLLTELIKTAKIKQTKQQYYYSANKKTKQKYGSKKQIAAIKEIAAMANKEISINKHSLLYTIK